MFVLTKFFGSKSFRDDFVNGDLYLSSLSRFTTVYAERGLHESVAQGDKQAEKLLKAQNNKRQMDILEGTIAMLNPDVYITFKQGSSAIVRLIRLAI